MLGPWLAAIDPAGVAVGSVVGVAPPAGVRVAPAEPTAPNGRKRPARNNASSTNASSAATASQRRQLDRAGSVSETAASAEEAGGVPGVTSGASTAVISGSVEVVRGVLGVGLFAPDGIEMRPAAAGDLIGPVDFRRSAASISCPLAKRLLGSNASARSIV